MRRKYEENGVFIVLLKWIAGLSHFTPPFPTPSEFRLVTQTVRWSPFLFISLVGGTGRHSSANQQVTASQRIKVEWDLLMHSAGIDQ